MVYNPDQWSLTKLPPEGHEDVGPFAWSLWQEAMDEKDRQQLPDIWRANYKLYRGDHWGIKKNKNTVTLNLFFANVQRTVANITARNPVAECVDLEGKGDGFDKITSARLKKWWQDTGQRPKIKWSAQKSEKYGITVEKAYWDGENPNIVVIDPFSFAPAPGNWEDIATDPPYVAHGFPEPIDGVEEFFGKKGVEPSDVYSTLGEDREEDRPITYGTMFGSTNHVTNNGQLRHPKDGGKNYDDKRALVVEVWVKDSTTKKEKVVVEEAVYEGETEIKPAKYEEQDVLKYPDGIRVITVTNEGRLVLDDKANPNINWELPQSETKDSYLWGKFPFYKSNSYTDTTSIWGFSAADQVGELNIKIDEIFSRMINYIMRSMTGILIIPPKSGITRNMLNNKPGLVLFPQTEAAAAGIRFVSLPNLPQSFFQCFEMLINMYDRIYAIQDADRGQAPNGVVAASAIVALQERNAVLIQHKINSIDYMVEQRGRCAISLWANHGHKEETVEVDGATQYFRGTQLMGRKFNYVVESGSTMPKTSLQIQEQAQGLYEAGAIDRQALLEALNFPNWQDIIERVGEGQLGQALQVLIQAGMPEESAMALKQYLMQPGQNRENQAGQEPQPGMPRGYQGEMAA